MKIKQRNCLILILILMNSFVQAQTESSITRVMYKLVPFAINPDAVLTKQQKDDLLKANLGIEKVECELIFTKNKSLFSLVEKPLLNNDFSYLEATILVSEKYYNDVVNKKKTRFEELGGEKLNINLPYNQYNWEITTETKTISGYTCYRAICKWNDFNIRRNSTYTYESEVWFTPKIPASFGPMGLDGLPGLVLEANYGAGGIHFYAIKIEFDVVDSKVKLDPPVVKYITEEEYQKRLIKDYENIGR